MSLNSLELGECEIYSVVLDAAGTILSLCGSAGSNER